MKRLQGTRACPLDKSLLLTQVFSKCMKISRLYNQQGKFVKLY